MSNIYTIGFDILNSLEINIDKKDLMVFRNKFEQFYNEALFGRRRLYLFDLVAITRKAYVHTYNNFKTAEIIFDMVYKGSSLEKMVKAQIQEGVRELLYKIRN